MSELDCFMEQVDGNILDTLCLLANSKASAENEAKTRDKSFPQYHRKQVLLWICSEFAYSISGETSYRRFSPDSSTALSLNTFRDCRRIFASELTKTDLLDLTNMFKVNFRSVHTCGPEVAIDELLAGWDSVKYASYLTTMTRKPHSPGLCYYLAVERVLYQSHYTRYCFDFEPSILDPKLTAAQACKRLVRNFPLENPQLKPLLYCDAAFRSQEIIDDLCAQRQPFVIAGAGARLPLVTALAQSHLPLDSHMLLEDQRGLVYSYTLMSKEGMSEASKRGLTPKVALTNAFYVSNRHHCRCVSAKVRAAALDVNKLSDDTLHIICEKLGLEEGLYPEREEKASSRMF